MDNFNNKVVCITGGGAGLGRALALQFARCGSNVALVDWNDAQLAATEKEIQALGVQAKGYKVDVSDRDMMFKLPGRVLTDFGGIDIVVNNAGICPKFVPVSEVDSESFQKIIDVCLWGVINGSLAFLPHLNKNTATSIVNISSIAGLLCTPTAISYNTAKFGVRGFTETLWSELVDTNINVLLVHPGFIKTDMVRNSPLIAEEEKEEIARQVAQIRSGITAEKAATILLKAIQKRRKRLLLGMDAKILSYLPRLFFNSYYKIAWRLI